MRNNFSIVYKILLIIADITALIGAFLIAYILRVTLDSRPVANPTKAVTYITLIIVMMPVVIGIFSILGLYTRQIFERRPKEAARLFIASIATMILFVTFDYFSNDAIFPAKLIPIYSVLVSFLLLWFSRTLMRFLRIWLYQSGRGIIKVVLVGDNSNTYFLAKYLFNNLESGYDVVGIVANKEHVYEKSANLQYRSLTSAIDKADPHAVIQTDNVDVGKVYNLAIENHLDYRFVPTHEALFSARHSLELLGAFPLINVYTTPLIGNGRVVKRFIDIVCSILVLIVTLPITLLIAVIMKLGDPFSPVIFKQKRLSRFKKSVNIYKFRTMKRKYNGLSPEEAFALMGEPNLIKQYRKNGDMLANDPRITTLGKFLRRTSLDELPQLLNVLKGDISLVGPRSLVATELNDYEFKSLILSVKSGLTGLAQISGRRDISFEERRKLDMYYVQNWSIWMDLQIIFRTIYMVLIGHGAK